MKFKTMTVNQLHRLMVKLINQGHGKLPVCINKDTFRDNCESDGAVILPVDGATVRRVYILDDDGGIKMTKAGRECERTMAVLHGTSGAGEDVNHD